MNQRLQTILLIAFLIAVSASYLVYKLVSKQISDNIKKQTTSVVVAATDLGIGSIIKATDLKTAAIIGPAPKDTIVKPEQAVGRGVLTAIYAGEPVMDKRLAPAGSGGGLAATIPPGMRACAVKVDEVVGLAGFVLPGMRVDVLISGGLPSDQNVTGTKVRTLLQNIEVLSAGKNIQPDSEGKPVEVTVVNLLVTPEQAEALSLATNQTKVQLVLRNPLDHEVVDKRPGTDMASMFGHTTAKETAPAPVRVARKAAPVVAPPPPAAPPVPPPFVVQIMNGNKTTEQKFAQDQPK